jgi:hypothetical protein
LEVTQLFNTLAVFYSQSKVLEDREYAHCKASSEAGACIFPALEELLSTNFAMTILQLEVHDHLAAYLLLPSSQCAEIRMLKGNGFGGSSERR